MCAVLALLGTPASAARIHHYNVPKLPPTTNLSFGAFLAAGPTVWAEVNPRVPHGLSLTHNPDGTLVDTPFLEFLLFRRSLNPTRFDHYHSNIAPELASYLPTLPAATLSPPLVSAPQTINRPPLTPPQGQHVPEPSTLLIGLTLLAGAAYIRRRSNELVAT